MIKAISVAVAAVFVVGAVLFLQDDESANVGGLHAGNDPQQESIETSVVSQVPAPLAQRPSSSPVSRSKIPLPRGSGQPLIGTSSKVPSLEHRMFLAFMFAGVAAESSDVNMMSMARSRYNLSDEEFDAFLSYAKETLAADRKFQADQKKELCASKSKLTDLNSFGLALNESTTELEVNQEALGQEAEAALGSALFMKIQSQIANEDRQEITVVDFPVLLVAQNRDLATELERLCPDVL